MSWAWRVVESGDKSRRIAARLYAVMVMVVLTAPAVAELFVFARLTTLAFRHGWCVGNNAATILAARQFAHGSYEPIELKVYSSEQIAYPQGACQLVWR